MTGRSEPTLAIDLGGTKLAFADVRGASVESASRVATPRTGRGVDLVAAVAAEAGRRGGNLRGRTVGVCTTGIVRAGRLTALNPTTLPVEDGFPLRDEIEAALGCRVVLVNDAQAAAWGEHLFGAGRDVGTFAFVTVSTGVGGGLVAGGRLQVGARGLAGHVGHMVADPHGPSCGCGRRGCVEAIASGTAIGVRASERLGRQIGAPEVFALAEGGMGEAEEVLDQAAMALAALICDLAAALDVDAVALGGGVGLATGFRERVERAVACLPEPFRRPVLSASCGGGAGLIGVAALACGRVQRKASSR